MIRKEKQIDVNADPVLTATWRRMMISCTKVLFDKLFPKQTEESENRSEKRLDVQGNAADDS